MFKFFVLLRVPISAFALLGYGIFGRVGAVLLL